MNRAFLKNDVTGKDRGIPEGPFATETFGSVVLQFAVGVDTGCFVTIVSFSFFVSADLSKFAARPFAFCFWRLGDAGASGTGAEKF